MTPQLNQVKSMVKEAGKSLTTGGVKTVGVCLILYVLITYTAPTVFEKGMTVFRSTLQEHNAALERISTNLAQDRKEVIGHLVKALDRTNTAIERNTEVIGANTTTLQETKSVLWRINNRLERDDKQGMIDPPLPLPKTLEEPLCDF